MAEEMRDFLGADAHFAGRRQPCRDAAPRTATYTQGSEGLFIDPM
jgi:hypothetical protein